MVLSDIEKIVKNVVEDNGYDRSSVNIVRSNYLATIILKSGVNLSLKKKKTCGIEGLIPVTYYIMAS